MNIVLVPGLWLDASSWDEVTPALHAAGHQTFPLTMPGVGAVASESASIGISDWVAATVAQIDSLDGPVVVVGHSGGGNVAWGAAEQRPDRVNHVVLIDTVPPPPGSAISEFDIVDGVVPFPGWDYFDSDDVDDLSPAVRERSAAATKPVPARVPTDSLHLVDERRYRVKVTVLSGRLDKEALRAVLAEWPPYAAEVDAIENFDVRRLGSGHWPQFSQPELVAEEIVAALSQP